MVSFSGGNVQIYVYDNTSPVCTGRVSVRAGLAYVVSLTFHRPVSTCIRLFIDFVCFPGKLEKVDRQVFMCPLGAINGSALNTKVCTCSDGRRVRSGRVCCTTTVGPTVCVPGTQRCFEGVSPEKSTGLRYCPSKKGEGCLGE